jgi:hypothetical protein
MENCLFTKLKGVVDNPNLPVFGCLKMELKALDNPTDAQKSLILRGPSGTKVNIKIEGGGTFSLESESYESQYTEKEVAFTQWNNINLRVTNNNGFISFISKYDITGIGTVYNADPSVRIAQKIFNINLNDFNYMPLVRIITSGIELKGEFKSQNWNDITELNLSESDISFFNDVKVNIGNLKDNTLITTLNLRSLNATGSINNLKSPALTDINLYNTKITGEINTLLDNIYAAGRTSGDVTINPINGLITDDGNAVTQEYINSKGGTSVIKATFSQEGYTKLYV